MRIILISRDYSPYLQKLEVIEVKTENIHVGGIARNDLQDAGS